MRTEPSFSAEPEDQLVGTSGGAMDSESQLLADYRQRYGLSVDPFVDDPHFPFYSGAQRRQILDQLLHLCQFSHNLQVVVGEYGVGKTRMAQALIDALDDADDICFLEGQITSSYESMIAEVLEQFELPDEVSLSEFAQRQSDQDGLLVVIVDNAHHLSDEVLLALINLFQSGSEARVHLVLFAEPHLLDRLENFNVPNVILSDFYLEKFSLSEAVDYLNFRMEMADYLGPEIFSESKVESWWRQSQGQLLALHDLAQDKLLESVSVPRRVSFNRPILPLPHIIAASALGAGLLMGFVYLKSGSSDTSEQLVNPIPVSQIATVSSSNVLSAQSSPAQSSIAVANSSLPAIAAESAKSDVQTFNSTNSLSSVAASSEAAVVKQSVVPLVQTNSVQSEGALKARQSSAGSSKKAVEASKPAVVADALPAKNNLASGSYTEQEKAILSWGESEFTLQLMGLSSEKAARDFIAAQSNKKDLMLFKGRRQGKDWFVVVTGRYSSSAKARQAVQMLPDEQKKASPWPREVKVIQGEIRQR